MTFKPLLLAASLLVPALLNAAQLEMLGKVSSSTMDLLPVPGSSRAFYLLDYAGGRRDCGELRRLENRRSKSVFVFNGYNGKSPRSLARIRKTVFGITTEGGRHGKGTLFRIRGRKIQTLVHFDETTGAAQSLHADGATLSGTCFYGTFAWRGRQFRFYPLLLPASAVLFRGTMYASRYFPGLYRLDDAGETLLQTDWQGELFPGKRTLLGLSTYRGKYGYGCIESYDPAQNTVRTIIDFQRYNGGYPAAAVSLPNGRVYAANAEGLWKITRRSTRVAAIKQIRKLHSDGRRIFGLAGYNPTFAFVTEP